MRPIETIDVSRPRASTGAGKAAAAAGDLGLAVLLVLILPIGLTILFSPLAGLVRVVLGLAGLISAVGVDQMGGSMTSAASAVVIVLATAVARTQDPGVVRLSEPTETSSPASLDHAQRLFYSGRYDDASAMTSSLCAADDLEACELRTSSLHFQIRRAMGDSADRERAWTMCAVCPELLSTFLAETDRARALARARLQRNPHDDEALFLLGKIDLNYVWLQLGTRARKTGWDQYWEARTSLDQVLERNPMHLRARVARAWIDYIVGTKMPRGTRWVLGGGSKKRGLQVVREAASSDGEFFERAEAAFALWDMQVREQELEEAVGTAQQLARDFPDNRELTRFLGAQRQPK